MKITTKLLIEHLCLYLLVQCISINIYAIDKSIALNTLQNQEEFERLGVAPESSTLARTEIVKFMVDRKKKRRLWFFNTEKYTYHYSFARDYLSSSSNLVPDHAVFNAREYTHKNRRFEMGTIVHYKDQNLWVLQLVAGDNLSEKEIVILFKQIKESMWIGNELRFLPLSIEQEKAIQSLNAHLPMVTSDSIFKSIQYQPLTQGRAIGYLRIVNDELDLSSVRPDQILVLEKLPNEIPVSAAVISQELQAPLSHVALLCGSRGTPNMGFRNALSSEIIRALDGKLVELNVGPQEFTLQATTLNVAKELWGQRHPTSQIPKVDLSEQRLLDLSSLKVSDARFAGAKAAQLGEVSKIRPVLHTPGGFIVPLSYYFEQLKQTEISSFLEKVLNKKSVQDITTRYAALDNLRQAIKSSHIDSDLIAKIRMKMKQVGHKGRWILRSSTNAEDLAGFNGAGLYRSIKISANSTDNELKDALRNVWASVWLQGAFDEREWFAMDHATVGMAILVQPFIEGAIANGVAITANPFAEFRPGLLINVEPFGGSVTGAEGDEIPEQHLVYTFSHNLNFELLSTSSKMPEGKTVLTKQSLNDLSNQLVSLHKHFIGRWNKSSNAVDVEFLVMDDQKILILQARPYQVKYSKEQRM